MNRGKPQIYQTLADQLFRLTVERKLKKGDPLPSEREIAEYFSCNHLTVRKALRLLAVQGKIHTIPSVGSFMGAVPQQDSPDGSRIGFLFPDDEIFYYRIFAAVEAVAAAGGLHPVVHLTGGSVNKEHELLDYFEHSGTRLLIAAPNRLCAERYLKLKIPVLFFDMPMPEVPVPQIVSDDINGAMTAVQTLIRLGHTRIAHIGCEYDFTGEQRLNGYLKALNQNKIPVRQSLIRMRYPSREWGYHACRELFKLKEPPGAVFCANDTIAAGVLDFCTENNFKVPKDLSVIGFGNTLTAEFLHLSSISQNTVRISGTLCRNLQLLISGQEVPMHTVIPTSYIERDSVAPPSRR